MADEAQDEGNSNADSHGFLRLAQRTIIEPGQTDYGIGDHVIQENDTEGLDKAGGIF